MNDAELSVAQAAIPVGPEAASSAGTAAGIDKEEPLVAAAPSFDCMKATTDVERLICATPSVAALDVKLSGAYRRLLGLGEDRAALKREQVSWLKVKRNVCESAECLRSEYQSRVDDLEARVEHYSTSPTSR